MLIACEDGRVVELGVSGGRVDFTGLDLHRAVLEQGCFDGGRGAVVSFRNVVALGASFDGAHLDGANLANGLLGRASFRGASLRGAVMSGCVAAGADFSGADLREARLVGAQRGGGMFAMADLGGADLEGSVLSGALFDAGTVWPDGFDPVAAGAVKIGESRSRFYSESVPRPELFG